MKVSDHYIDFFGRRKFASVFRAYDCPAPACIYCSVRKINPPTNMYTYNKIYIYI